MNILLLDGYFGGSHIQWAKSIQKFSSHHIEILSLSANHWKWRMQGAAIHFAKQINEQHPHVDLFLVTDMLNLPLFKSLLNHKYQQIPIVLYMHENQLTYPWSPDDPELKLKRDAAYGFINYSSALVADQILYNSKFHLNSFLDGIEKLLQKLPDYKHFETIVEIEKKSAVIHVGINLKKIQSYKIDRQQQIPIILWNHRWEYDKDPETFFETLFKLKDEGEVFKLVVVGREYKRQPEIFTIAKERLADCTLQFGYAETSAKYYEWLWKADIIPVTNRQDFFGISVVEAIACECYPILPDDLCYGEHLDSATFAEHFYSRGTIYDKLKNALSIKNEEKGKLVAKEMIKYNWKKLASDYDRCFENLVASKK